MNAMTASGGAVRAVTDEQILSAYRLLASTEGIFCEPASAASVAGLLAHGAGDARRVACVLTGHGLKDPADRARPGRRGGAVRSGAERRSSGRSWDDAGPAAPGPRARLLGQSRARLRRAGGRAGAASRARGRGDRQFAVVHRARCPARRARTSSCGRSSGCTPPTTSSSGSRRRSRSAAGWARAPRPTLAGLMAADHLFELDADVLALATELEGHPDNVAAALRGGFVICDGARSHRFELPMGLEAVLVVPTRRCATTQARAALPAPRPARRRRVQRRPRPRCWRWVWPPATGS